MGHDETTRGNNSPAWNSSDAPPLAPVKNRKLRLTLRFQLHGGKRAARLLVEARHPVNRLDVVLFFAQVHVTFDRVQIRGQQPAFLLTLSAAAWRTRIDRREKPSGREDDKSSPDYVYPDFHLPNLSQTTIPHAPAPSDTGLLDAALV